MTANRRNKTGAEMTSEVLDKLTKFSEPNKAFALRLHELILQADATLQPRLWYGMPGYAKTKDSAVLCFFREDEYMTFGLTEHATFTPKPGAENLLMPSAWFFTDLNDVTEQKIVEIVTEAVAK